MGDIPVNELVELIEKGKRDKNKLYFEVSIVKDADTLSKKKFNLLYVHIYNFSDKAIPIKMENLSEGVEIIKPEINHEFDFQKDFWSLKRYAKDESNAFLQLECKIPKEGQVELSLKALDSYATLVIKQGVDEYEYLVFQGYKWTEKIKNKSFKLPIMERKWKKRKFEYWD